MDLKRFLIKVEKVSSDTHEWTVRVLCADTRQELLQEPRRIRWLSNPGKPSLAFPFPPEDEVQRMDKAALHYQLCANQDLVELDRIYRGIYNRNLKEEAKDTLTFGSYLFATLLGDEAWKRIKQYAGTQGIELALCWHPSEWGLSRLPWEIMSASMNTFIAAEPGPIAITRIVPTPPSFVGTIPALVNVSLPLKVLFVVGAKLDDTRIRPGAEYLGLLLRLQEKGAGNSLNPSILIGASGQTIKEEIARFKPSIVHFICHGRLDPKQNKGFLELVSDDQSDKVELDAAELYALLTSSGYQQAPPIIVLNACYLGKAASQESVPMAAKLVELGVPMVVAMGGEIADRACRLFTCSFYLALLKGMSITSATAEGRRDGITYAGRSESRVDWAFPTLFLSEKTSPSISIDRQKTWSFFHSIANDYYTMSNPRAFCGRLNVLEEDYKKLVSIGEDEKLVRSVLAIEVNTPPTNKKNPQYGKSRLLDELAAKAVRDGHIPCLVRAKDGRDQPTNVLELGMKIVGAIDEARRRFQLDIVLDAEQRETFLVPKHQLLSWIEETILGRPVAKAVAASSKLKYQTEFQSISIALKGLSADQWSMVDSDIIKTALKEDLGGLEREARKHYPDIPHMMVLVLLDDVHRFDAAARDFVQWLGTEGLGSFKTPVPIIFTFSSNQQGERTEYTGAVKVLTDYLSQKRSYVAHAPLGPFCKAVEDPLPYKQYLLYYDTSLVISRAVDSADQDDILGFFEEFDEAVKGIPSRLEVGPEENNDVGTLIRLARRLKVLLKADDESFFKTMIPGGS